MSELDDSIAQLRRRAEAEEGAAEAASRTEQAQRARRIELLTQGKIEFLARMDAAGNPGISNHTQTVTVTNKRPFRSPQVTREVRTDGVGWDLPLGGLVIPDQPPPAIPPLLYSIFLFQDGRFEISRKGGFTVVADENLEQDASAIIKRLAYLLMEHGA